MIWYAENLKRFRSEREAIESLTSSVDWLTPIRQHIDDSARLLWDFDIATTVGTRSVTLRYPNHFPHSPPTMLPRGNKERWSVHQYGPGGELCLEYGPDNWDPQITGADMISSAYRLLEGEQPTLDQTAMVASRHKTTIGQELRNKVSRLLVTRDLAEVFARVSEDTLVSIKSVGLFRGRSYVNVVTSMTLPNGEEWKAEDLPEVRILGYESMIALIRWPDSQPLPSTQNVSKLRAELAARNMVLPAVNHAVLLWRTLVKLFYLSDDDSIYEGAIIPPQPFSPRMDEDHAALADKTAALIGCGSLGSKMAVSLARAGVGAFLLVDDDIVLPDNLIRNDLDWRDVGSHKADSVARKIQLVNPKAKVSTRRYRLGGQEASGDIESLIDGLGKCDLLIEATADAKVFNYLCAAVNAAKTPLLWAEVFGGGFGGLVARHRPSIDPAPATMRNAIESWCHGQGMPIERAVQHYRGGQSMPAIANDADVSVIAAHAVRMSIDLLIPRDPSQYPSSVYLIGLSKGWIFEQPFETYPIDVGGPVAGPEEILDQGAEAEERARIFALFREYIDAATSKPKGDETTSP